MRSILFLPLLILCFNIEASSLLREKPNIDGNWKSVSSEDFHDGTFGTRLYRFEDNSWEETLIIYEDRELVHPILKIRYEGYYDISSKSASIYKAYNINFHYSKKTLTLLTDDKERIKSLGIRACSGARDVEVDISNKGCSFIASLSEYPIQYDIVKMEMDLLFLGIHSYKENIDDSEKRPKYFHYPLRKFDPKKESDWVKNQKSIYAFISYDVKDQNGMDSFLDGYVESMHKYGGIELNYNNSLVAFEGEQKASNVILQIWPDKEQFERWWKSADFKPWKISLMKSARISVSLSNKYEPESVSSE